MIPIEKNIPLTSKSGARPIYPWESMEIGDSFFAEGLRPITMTNARVGAERKYHTKYMTRTVDGGVRVWRVK